MSNVCSIYVITNTANGKQYVGQTWRAHVEDRLSEHFQNAKSTREPFFLQKAIRKYGTECFVIEKIDEASTQKIADYLEDFYILAANTLEYGYNIRRGGSVGLLSKETREKISKALKGFYVGHTHPNYGKPCSQEQRDRLSKIRAENRELFSEQKLGSKNPNSKLDEDKVLEIICLIKNGKTDKEIANLFSLERKTINNIRNNKSWKHVRR